jgi:hypothetical protein
MLPLCCACHDDDARDAPPTGDAGTSESLPTASMDAGQTPLIVLVRSEIELYDRRIRASCPCLVASGAYQSEQECFRFGLSGPDWAECATRALATFDSPTTREQSQCYLRFLADAAECTEAAACDEGKLATCGTPDLDCLALQNERLNLILTACPDFGLLSRLPTSGQEMDASSEHVTDSSTQDAAQLGVVASDYLNEYNREIEITCPCRVEQHSYPSQEDCRRALALSPETVECLIVQLQSAPALSPGFACMADLSRMRSDCVASSHCEQTLMNACYEHQAACPMLEPQELTRVFNACPDSILLGR